VSKPLLLFFGLVVGLFSLAYQSNKHSLYGVVFKFKGFHYELAHPMQRDARNRFVLRNAADNARLDTLSNWFDPEKQYVEIVRQDDVSRPEIGIALGFEFDEHNEEFPYTPAHAVIQIKDFKWGGVEFSPQDTMNFTGVSNAVSEDIQIEIDGFEQDTIWGHFSGLLINGAGAMATLESGTFRAKVYRNK
jgi:hypothetical protein